MATKTKDVQIRFELTYLDFMGNRQAQSYIPTLEEAINRQQKYYNSVECDSKINKVIEYFEDGECVNIERVEQ